MRAAELKPPAPRAPVMQAELDACDREMEIIGGEIAELALADAEGARIDDRALVALHEKRKALLFRIEVKTLGHGLAVQLDKAALAKWKVDALDLPPEDAVAGITATACCTACSQGQGCILSGFGACLHPKNFTRYPLELKGSPAAFRHAAQLLQNERVEQ